MTAKIESDIIERRPFDPEYWGDHSSVQCPFCGQLIKSDVYKMRANGQVCKYCHARLIHHVFAELSPTDERDYIAVRYEGAREIKKDRQRPFPRKLAATYAFSAVRRTVEGDGTVKFIRIARTPAPVPESFWFPVARTSRPYTKRKGHKS